MIRIIATLIAFLVSIITTAQVTEIRDVAQFSKLKASQGIDVFYSISDKINVLVETDDAEKMKIIKTEVVGETLKLYIETESYTPKEKKRKNKYNDVRFKVLKITVSGPNLENIKASSSADIKIENTNKSENLHIEVSSSGRIAGNFDCTNLQIDASSSGDFIGTIQANLVEIASSSSSDVKLSGTCKSLVVKASSSSDCLLKDLATEKATVAASSSSDVYLTVSQSITAKASSSADIVIYGTPSEVSKEATSSGSVTQK